MINIKGRKDYLIALESVAMTDIVLNMFIFFFISFSILYTFSPERISRIQVRLPKASSATALEGEEKAIVVITKSGEYYIDDARLGLAQLKSALIARRRSNDAFGVILKVDRLAKFDSVAGALDVINELNIQKVSIAVVKNTH